MTSLNRLTKTMGADSWMIIQADGAAKDCLTNQPTIDRKASTLFARSIFPNEELSKASDGDLTFTSPPGDELLVGDFGQVRIAAATEFGIDYPSRLPERFISRKGATTLHAMHSVVDWFAFAHWIDGKLVRSLSLSPDSGVLEDIGERIEFERPFWDGEHPAVDDDEDEDDYPFVFHPLELGEAALAEFFGYQLEGIVNDEMIEPEEVPLMRFKRSKIMRTSKPWWRFWK